jgi:hypothetical protein
MRIKLRFEMLLVVLAFLVSLAFFVHAAQVAASSSPATTASEPTPSDKGQPQTKTENDMLKAQLEVIRDYDQRLLATVYASLGGVFLLVVLVGGLNWFTNYRLYERERDSLRQSLQFASQEEAAKISQGFEEFKKRIESHLANNSAEVKAAAEEAANSSTQPIMHSLWMAEYENTKFRAEYFSSKDDGGYRCIQAWIEHLEVLGSLDWFDERWVGPTIGKILEALPKSNVISYQSQAKLFNLLEKAPPILLSDVQRLKIAIEAKRKI